MYDLENLEEIIRNTVRFHKIIDNGTGQDLLLNADEWWMNHCIGAARRWKEICTANLRDFGGRSALQERARSNNWDNCDISPIDNGSILVVTDYGVSITNSANAAFMRELGKTDKRRYFALNRWKSAIKQNEDASPLSVIFDEIVVIGSLLPSWSVDNYITVVHGDAPLPMPGMEGTPQLSRARANIYITSEFHRAAQKQEIKQCPDCKRWFDDTRPVTHGKCDACLVINKEAGRNQLGHVGIAEALAQGTPFEESNYCSAVERLWMAQNPNKVIVALKQDNNAIWSVRVKEGDNPMAGNAKKVEDMRMFRREQTRVTYIPKYDTPEIPERGHVAEAMFYETFINQRRSRISGEEVLDELRPEDIIKTPMRGFIRQELMAEGQETERHIISGSHWIHCDICGRAIQYMNAHRHTDITQNKAVLRRTLSLADDSVEFHICDECEAQNVMCECNGHTEEPLETYERGVPQETEHYTHRDCMESVQTLHGEEQWCRECVNHQAITCNGCDAIMADDEAVCWHNDQPYCEQCDERMMEDEDDQSDEEDDESEEERLGIMSWHYHKGTSPRFFVLPDETRTNNKELSMGLEWEIDSDSYPDKGDATDIIKREFDAGEFYMEHDGSLNHGFEVCFQPATIRYWLENRMNRMERAAKALRKEGWSSHDVKTCGMHIHLSNPFDRETRLRFQCNLYILFDRFWDELRLFSRRTSSQIGNMCAKVEAETWLKQTPWMNKEQKQEGLAQYARELGRYYAVNVSNDKTTEIRLWRGTLNPDTIRATLLMTACIREIALKVQEPEEILRMKSFEHMTDTGIDILADNERRLGSWTEDIQTMYDYAKKRGCIPQEPEEVEDDE